MSKGTYSYSSRHRMHEEPMTKDEIEIAGLKKDLIRATTTITNLSAFLKAKKAELSRTRSEYQELVTDYLALRKLQKQETQMLDYILNDCTAVSVVIDGDKYIAMDREEIQQEMEKDKFFNYEQI